MKRRTLTCDEVLAKFLLWLSRSTDATTFRLSTEHVILYRDCLNEIGFRKLETLLADEGAAADKYIVRTKPDTCGPVCDFSAMQDSEFIPEISNEFILSYCHERKAKLFLPKRQRLVRMTERLCGWIYNEGYTSRRLLKQSATGSC